MSSTSKAWTRFGVAAFATALAVGCGSGDSGSDATPFVSAVTAQIANGQSGTGGPFNFTGTVTASSATTVTYRWELSTGELQPVQELKFGGAGNLSTTYTFAPGTVCIGNDIQMWARLNVLTPNVMESAKVTFTRNCVEFIVPRIPI